MSAPEGRPFKITGADGERIDIPAGEYYFNTKARARRMMLNSLSPEARRVYACLELATMGFQRELAVVAMGGGKQRPLTRADIAKQTGFSEAHARRGLVELEDAGLAERQGIGGGPLHKGRIEIYSWANPRAAKKKKGSQRAAPIPEWFPKSWDPLKPLISRFKLKLLPELGPARGSLIQKGEEAAREYQKAEKEACALLKQVCAEPKNAAHKRKNGKNVERTESPAPPPVPVPISKESATASGRAEITTGVHTPEGGAPARPPELAVEKRLADPPWHAELRVILKSASPPTVLDEPMFLRIASHLREELLPQFKTAIEDAPGIRKWPGIEAIAKQVANRGIVQGAGAGATKQPPQSAKKGFVDSVKEEAQRRLAKYGRI